MSDFKVDFGSMEWQSRRQGARYKLFQQGSRQLRESLGLQRLM
jgi:hypothetical protein